MEQTYDICVNFFQLNPQSLYSLGELLNDSLWRLLNQGHHKMICLQLPQVDVVVADLYLVELVFLDKLLMGYFCQILELRIDHVFGISVNRGNTDYVRAVVQKIVFVNVINLIFSSVHKVDEPFRVSLLVFKGYKIEQELLGDIRVVKILNFQKDL